ncbi:hypothetical protein HJC23_008788 [Cyclotella cryptica]|uniref:Uncharacterized protein n=1 Tax=Cyclotella cryptica TaxID=29204 RepID=A0ABD3PS34_9STRA
MMTSRTIKWTTLLILLCLTFFLGSFNATVRIIVDQRKEIRQFEKDKKLHNAKKPQQHSEEVNTPYDGNAQSEHPHTQHTAGNHLDNETLSALHKVTQEQINYQQLKKERQNPTLGRYRSFSRPLDEFDFSDPRRVMRSKHHSLRENTQSQQSYSRQAHYHSTPQTNSTHLLADAHFAKALRMVSSTFDKLEGGGNALPEEVYSGGYKQEKRGEKFVRMDWLKRGRRKTRGKTTTANAAASNSGGGHYGKRPIISLLSDRGDVAIFSVLMEIVHDWYVDIINGLYETLGIEMDGDETRARNKEEGNVLSEYTNRNEEDLFSWSDTKVGSQLLSIYGRIASIWSRHPRSRYESTDSRSSSKDDETSSSAAPLSNEDRIALEGLFHLEKAAELGHAEAQRMVANSLASGILPLSDHSLIQRYAKWQYINSNYVSNFTTLLAQSTLVVPDDFSSGGEQLSRAIVLWHLSAMDGNVESAMALGFRHLYSAMGGTTKIGDASTMEDHISPGYLPTTGGATDAHGTSPTSHYGVLGTCPTALAYYEAAANGVMDALESGPTKGKVSPPIDEHRLAEIHMHGGASVALDQRNKPDELEEALQYYRMLASRKRSPEPDLVAAFTIANFYHLGLRGVKQDLRLALKYYEICGDYNHWEGGGLAGLFHVWGIGMSPEERDLGKAYYYFLQGTPGGIEGCSQRMKKKRKASDKDAEEIKVCDRHCANGMGLISLLGIDGLVERSISNARKWFEISKDLGDSDGQYNYAMLRLGWMVIEINDDTFPTGFAASSLNHHGNSGQPLPYNLNYLSYRRQQLLPHDITGPSASDYTVALQELSRAASKGHIQARHKLAMIYASGAEVPKKNGKPTIAVAQSCIHALFHYKSIAEAGNTVSQRNRAAWKQYNSGDSESALRNYLATAETGSLVGQLNAAFLLERGHCLGMTTEACTRASIRLWRAAARQGSLEACLRVGDFYFYGRMKKQPTTKWRGVGELSSQHTLLLYGEERSHKNGVDGKAFYFAPGPYRWARYILYPEEIIDITLSWLAVSLSMLLDYTSRQFYYEPKTVESSEAPKEDSSYSACLSGDKGSGTCIRRSHTDADTGDVSDREQVDEHMAIAAQYYRKAAEEHKSGRANFNLGFMYEWGLGLTQDFPLAKRHYDLAREEADLAASLALFAMGVHEKMLKGWVYINAKYMDK